MGGNKPNLIITDQDPAMRVAIEKVFSSSSHRLCMWHIMKKVSEKVGVSLNGNSEFNNKFKSCVWGSETPDEFEATWKSVMIEFELEKNEWLSHMYDIRSMWIPSYFRDILLGGILRTTSRSESENSFYGNFLNPNVSLVEFWMRFESALDAQRYKELLADNNSLHTLPKLKLDRGLERHGRDIYTRENFYIFQNELWAACVDCGVENRNQKDGMDILHIIDNNETNRKVREVVYNISDSIWNCSCKMFEAQGIPCRHILCILKGKGLNEIPSQYILNRWTKLATKQPIFDVDGNLLEGCAATEKESQLISKAWNHLFKCMHMAGQHKEKLHLIINECVKIEKQLFEFEGDSTQTKKKELESLIGFELPTEVNIRPPKQSKTKGSGKRIKGGKEKAIEQQQKKPPRLCRACGQYVYHDSRNCPSKSSP
ncbi:protein FAR1-related sequence 5-like [Trifolium pratense]|uniref:Protein FAR1-related sequence 5-like n=1 Tax=Trifolium pratense TaxID=57577 RepID=A0A2K3P235_TRIPR|nr:protein FAR1-related sequence 5-like [Trifolium pratense]